MQKPISVLASFATLKSLNDGKTYKSSYQLLSEFISYIIQNEKLYTFTAFDMKNKLTSVFGFNIPEAVVKTAIKTLEYIDKGKDFFVVNKEKIEKNLVIEQAKQKAEKISEIITNKLFEFVQLKCPEENISDIEKDFISFVIDDQQLTSSKYIDLISEFVLSYENDSVMQEYLSNIREGSIIYIGINYNINETGSLTKPLTLYLGMEILFSLAGYNGEICQQLAQDFLDQVRAANVNGKKIKLLYFNDTKTEIDRFFMAAEAIVEGQSYVFDTTAMKIIVNGCSSVSDVKIKKSDFYFKMKATFGIIEDTNYDYYTEAYNKYNLESLDQLNKQDDISWRIISHINKLRKGVISAFPTDSEFLFITNTSSILKASREQVDRIKREKCLELVSDYAVTMERITNILWYKLGNGFGQKNYPSNVNSVLKARIVLSSNISHNVAQLYRETAEKYQSGEISSEQLAARIISLRKKPLLPEEISIDIIDDALDFSEEWLNKYEEQVQIDKTLIIEQNKQIEEQKKKNEILNAELKKYKEADAKKDRRKQKNKQVLSFCWRILWKVLILLAIVWLAFFFKKQCNADVPFVISLVIEAIGIILTIISIVKKDIVKSFPRQGEKKES